MDTVTKLALRASIVRLDGIVTDISTWATEPNMTFDSIIQGAARKRIQCRLDDPAHSRRDKQPKPGPRQPGET